ncbi:hypothetical protein [Streptococcus salivarius]|uniref:hypothetical protein n=1 Tax=Streptococcus salivarius TaxID=1304 RepID=UPI0018AC545E|nr:hypothetical protein [Streptococcus salivarius]
MIATEIDLLEELTLKNAVVNWNAAKVTADGHVSMIQDAVEIAKDLVFPNAAFAIVMPEGEECPRIKPCTHWEQGDEVLIPIVITPDMADYARAYDVLEHKVKSLWNLLPDDAKLEAALTICREWNIEIEPSDIVFSPLLNLAEAINYEDNEQLDTFFIEAVGRVFEASEVAIGEAQQIIPELGFNESVEPGDFYVSLDGVSIDEDVIRDWLRKYHSDKSLTEQAEKVLKLHKTLEKLGDSLRDQLDDISDLCDEQIKHVTKED